MGDVPVEGLKAPETMLDKVADCHEESQIVSNFVDWMLDEKGLGICEYAGGDNGWIPVNKTGETLRNEYFGIDAKKLEKERQALLDSIRSS